MLPLQRVHRVGREVDVKRVGAEHELNAALLAAIRNDHDVTAVRIDEACVGD
jgi:hypothetical protein